MPIASRLGLMILIGVAAFTTTWAQTPDFAAFAKEATQGGMAEVELGKAALSRTPDRKIRAFADRMIKDHSRANDELSTLARSKGLSVASTLDTDHLAVVERLSAKTGRDFDAAYTAHMKTEHRKTIALFESAAKSSDPDLARFAAKTLPTLKEHGRLADELPSGSH